MRRRSMSHMRSRRAAAYLALVVLLAGIAVFASRMRMPDTFFYTRAAERMINPGCAEIHCFRVLVPWVLGALPGPPVVRWKGYAVVLNAAAALAVFDLCLLLGLSRRASLIAAFLTAFGFGSLYTLFEPYTSDPVMFSWPRSSRGGHSRIGWCGRAPPQRSASWPKSSS